MIFTAVQASQLQHDGEMLICRPLFRRDGRPIAYRVGQTVPIQPGRFQTHTFHAVIAEMRPTTVGALRAGEGSGVDWKMPDEWGDGMEVFDMRLVVHRSRCRTCRHA